MVLSFLMVLDKFQIICGVPSTRFLWNVVEYFWSCQSDNLNPILILFYLQCTAHFFFAFSFVLIVFVDS